jgi:hypothetical protein
MEDNWLLSKKKAPIFELREMCLNPFITAVKEINEAFRT